MYNAMYIYLFENFEYQPEISFSTIHEFNLSIASFIRWGHTPVQEAERGNHMAVVEFLKTV